MKPIWTFILLINNLTSFGQKMDMTFRTPNDTTQNKYLSILPDSPLKGFIVIMPGAGTEPYEVLSETKLPMTAARNGYAVFIPKLVPFNMIDETEDNNELLLESLIVEITTQYNLSKTKFIIGGHSIGGQQALFYAEQAIIAKKNLLKPTLVFGVDPPLDMKRLYNTKARDVALNPPPKEEHPQSESEFILTLFKAMYKGSPTENPKEYERVSAFYRDSKEGGNIQYLKDIPIRLYADPDIDWMLSNWKIPVEFSNLADITAAIIQLRLLGNKNAEFVNCLGKGFKPNGARHIHQFSMLDADEFMLWVNKN